MIICPSARGVLRPHVAVITGVTWNPSDAGPRVSLSNGNLTATGITVTGNNNVSGVRATASHSSGKYYCEMHLDVVGGVPNAPWIGIKSTAGDLNFAGPFGDGTDYGAYMNSTVHVDYEPGSNQAFVGPSPASGDVVMFAVDLTAGKLWVGWNGTWDSGASPAAGTGSIISVAAGTYAPWAALRDPVVVTGHFAASSWTYSAPSGFGEW